MNFTKGLTLVALAASLSLFAFAGNEGGGGGGICQNGKCITLSQAGFRIVNTPETRYSIPSVTIHELDRITQIFDALNIDLGTADIIGKPSDIMFVEVVEPSLYLRFITEYREVLSSHQSDVADKVELLGFTSEGKTYLIKTKFDALDTRGQGLLLIHEALLRNFKTTLIKVMKFDGALVDLLNAIDNNQRPDYISFLDTAYMEKVGDPDPYSYPDLYKEYLSFEGFRRSNLLAEFLLKYDTIVPVNHDKAISYSELLRLNERMPYISNYVTPGVLEFAVSISRYDIVTKFYAYVRSFLSEKKKSTIQVSNDTWEDFLKSGMISPVELEGLKICGNVKAKNSYALALEGAPAKLIHFKCETYVGGLITNMEGTDLNLNGPVTCKWQDLRLRRMTCE